MQTDQYAPITQPRHAALTSLAVIGFIALIALGMWLAVYSARYVPAAVSRIGAAAVSLSSFFVPAPSNLEVVSSTPTTTLPFVTPTATQTTPVAPVKKSPPIATQPGTQTSGTYQIGGTASAPLSGLADLVVTITSVGYLSNDGTSTFVAATNIPAGMRPAVKFTIKNVGTNLTNSWRFSASIPTQGAYLYQSQPQQNLNPGDSIDYTLGFDRPNVGNQTISITANFDHAVPESNTSNDSASANIQVLGS